VMTASSLHTSQSTNHVLSFIHACSFILYTRVFPSCTKGLRVPVEKCNSKCHEVNKRDIGTLLLPAMV